MGTVLGIDLGTTNSVAAAFINGQAEIILTPDGHRDLPSMVAFTEKGERLVGHEAKRQAVVNPHTIYSVKRLMGKRFTEVATEIYQFKYPIVQGPKNTIRIKVAQRFFSPEEISAMILLRVKEAAEKTLEQTVDGTVITVPAYFNDSQRQATRDAAEIAGLNVLRIINEPTAASLAVYGESHAEQTVAVYDFGGGTFDISVLRTDGEVVKVLATAGDVRLGGDDLDFLLARAIINEIKQQYEISLENDLLAWQRIREASEIAKRELSSVQECEINLPFIAENESGPIHFMRYVTRRELEKLIESTVERTLSICKHCVEKAKITVDELDDVVLVGGSSRIPLVRERVKAFFKKEPNKKTNPDEVVALGAAVQAAISAGVRNDVLLMDVIPLSLGVRTHGGSFTRLLEGNTTIPTSRSMVFSTAVDNQQEVDILVYQGESPIVEENKLLGQFSLRGIRSAPRGVPRIEVSFRVDMNGILTVSAMDLSSKIQQEIVVNDSGLLSEEEISRLKKNAAAYQNEDGIKMESARIKNRFLRHLYWMEDRLARETGRDEVRSCVESFIELQRQLVEEVDLENMKQAAQEWMVFSNDFCLLYNIPEEEIRKAPMMDLWGNKSFEPVKNG